MFEYRFIKFQWHEDLQLFEPIKFNCEIPYDSLRTKYTDAEMSYSESLRQFYRILFGACEIEVPKKSIMRLLIDEVLNPFYIFQVFAMALWFWDGFQSSRVLLRQSRITIASEKWLATIVKSASCSKIDLSRL